ncbi:MAG: hypothetical protein ABSB69_16610 [Solirubrobacteraceae bacterium]
MHGLCPIAMFALIENGLSFVVFGAIAFSLLMSLAFLFTRGGDSAYDRIGAGGISREGDYGGGLGASAPDSPAAQAEREREIRQMLGARSERLVRSGQPALDLDAEVARLLAGEQASGARDAELIAEVRQLVVARNERRVRQGLDPLDVDGEVARTLDELEP